MVQFQMALLTPSVDDTVDQRKHGVQTIGDLPNILAPVPNGVSAIWLSVTSDLVMALLFLQRSSLQAFS